MLVVVLLLSSFPSGKGVAMQARYPHTIREFWGMFGKEGRGILVYLNGLG
jgi:G:T/U-mismatch repair DNA glycosylase